MIKQQSYSLHFESIEQVNAMIELHSFSHNHSREKRYQENEQVLKSYQITVNRIVVDRVKMMDHKKKVLENDDDISTNLLAEEKEKTDKKMKTVNYHL